jgi:hypothetical protein
VIVEVAGLPLAGKSTLRDAIAAELERRGVASGGRADLDAPVRMALRRPGALLLAVLVLVRSTRPLADRRDAFRFVAATIAGHEAARRRPDRVWLLDEGPVQRAFMLFVDADRTASDDAVVRFARRMPASDAVVWADADVDEVLRRRTSRDRGVPPRLAQLDDATLRGRLEEGRRVLEVALVTGGAVRIDGRDVEQIVDRLVVTR